MKTETNYKLNLVSEWCNEHGFTYGEFQKMETLEILKVEYIFGTRMRVRVLDERRMAAFKM